LLVCVGSIAFDSVETPDGRADDVLGGSAVYFGFAASLFGPVGLLGVVGEDFPDENVDLLNGRGIDTEGVARVPGRTFRWAGRYVDDMNVRETTNLELNVFGEFDPVVPPAYRDAQFWFLANGSPAIQHRVLDQLESPSLVLADTMNHWIEGERDDVLRMLQRVDGVIINDEEAVLLSDRKNLVAATRAVARMGPKIVVVKKGAHGSLLAVDDAIYPLPAFPLEDVHDPTGAGDCFAGAFMGYLAGAQDASVPVLRRAALYGTLVAAYNCETFGVQRLLHLGREELEGRARDFAELLTPASEPS
jgi:sugar/nucleoside kinase (ribokinase family)